MIEIELNINQYNNKIYYIKGTTISHREDGPAVECANGDKFWLQNGKYHRLDGPAIEDANGHKYWYQNGQRHRLDGPAVECANGDKEWYINDELIYCQTQVQFEKLMKLKAFW